VEAHFEVNIIGDLVEQEIENGVGFRFGDNKYATGRNSQVTLIDDNVGWCTYVTILFDD
jgi:hypothetical protein